MGVCFSCNECGRCKNIYKQIRKCPKCGASNFKDKKVCKKCGTLLESNKDGK